MDQNQEADQDLRAIVTDETDKVLCVLGWEFIARWKTTRNIRQTVLVLGEKNLYQAGTFFEPFDGDEYRTRKGHNIIPVTDLMSFEIIDKPVGPNVGKIGAALLVAGLGIFTAGLIEGSGLGMFIGLFAGVVWMAVPGGLMLAHAKTGARQFLDFELTGGRFAISTRWFSEDDLSKFQKDCRAIMAR